MQLAIRFATQNDFQLIRQLDPHSQYIDPKKIKRKIDEQEVILAFDENGPVGLLKISYLWATRPYMDLIWVVEQNRGKGIGTQLLTFLEKYLEENGYTYLCTSSEANESAPQQWHLKHGFQPCGTLSAINLPLDQTNEVFFFKHIGESNPNQDKLKTYPI